MAKENRFVVTPRAERSVTMTVRIDAEYHQKLEELAQRSGRSRNALINMALKFALDNVEFADQEANRPK